MLVSKHAAELCAHLVNDFFGELPARIIAVLFGKGKSTIVQIVQHTSLSPRAVRHGLAVLVQQNLLFVYAAAESRIASYEANPDACYNLARSGKIIEMVGEEFGPAEEEVLRTLVQLGHARVSDLVQAFGFQAANGDDASNGHLVNGDSNTHSKGAGNIHSLRELYAVLGRLVIAEIIDQVGPKTLRNPDDVFREIEDEITKTLPGEKSTAKQKEKMRDAVVAQFQAAREESKKLKRQLSQTMPLSVKRRKLSNGVHSNGSAALRDVAPIDPNVVLKVNFEKCLVDLRNQSLSQYATDSLGDASGQVYLTLLRLLSDKVARCRSDSSLGESDHNMTGDDHDTVSHSHSAAQTSVTSIQIFDALDDSVNLSSGVGKASKDKIDFRTAERIRGVPRNPTYDSDDSDVEMPVAHSAVHDLDSEEEDHQAEEQEEGEAEDDDEAPRSTRDKGRRGTKVKFDEGTSNKNARFEQMRQHLLLLCQSQQGFVRHSGTQGRGQWTVDFKHVMDGLRRTEADAVIEQTFGRHGLRLTRILRSKGKLDEKTLPALALMKKGDVQGKMLALQMAGFVDVQEVPRDNSRTANRTMFFWFYDEERVQSRLLDDLYKTMLRCLQTLDVERHRERNILSFVERKDVRGKEEEVMTAEHYNKYSRFLELQSKLLGHVMRLDDLVSVFKDF